MDSEKNPYDSMEELFHLLSLAIEQSNEGVAITDSDGKIIYLNDAFSEMHGYSSNELIGKNLSTFHNKEQMDSASSALSRMKQTGNFNGEICHQKKDGTIVLAMMHNSVVKDTTGKPVGMFITVHGITDPKQTEKAMMDCEERYQTMLENIEDGYYEVDLAGNFTYCNNSICNILGYSKSELIGTNYREHVDQKNAKKLFQKFNRVLTIGKHAKAFDWELIKKDGTKCHIDTSISLITDANNHVSGFRGVARDITERKKYEEAFRKSEEKYRSFVQNFQGIAYRAHLGTWIPIFFHGAVEEITGYSEAEFLLGSPYWYELILPDDMKYLPGKEELRNVPNYSIKREYRIIRKDGNVRWVHESSRNVCDESGKPIEIEGTVTDITSRKQAEEELKESGKRYRDLSIIDDLTQLYNSRHFYNELKMEINRANRYEEPMTLILLDIDNFKAFNDSYGHLEGDRVLMRVGQVIKKCLRKTDSAFRYGGEEFMILLPMTICEDGLVTAERIRTEFKRETFSPVPGENVHITLSIGVGQYEPREEMRTFVHRVDMLMYEAKKNGKDMTFYIGPHNTNRSSIHLP